MTTQAIRDAVHDGDYTRAAELFAEWVESRPTSEESLREMADLARWAQEIVICVRAQAEARVQQRREEAHAVSAYLR